MRSQNEKAFGQFSSTQSQRPNTIGPVEIELDTQEDTIGKEYSLYCEKGDIMIKKSGLYLIIAGPQVGKERGDKPRWIDFWFRVNNKDIPNSNVRYTIKDAWEKNVIITQTVTHLSNGDMLNVMMSVEDTEEGIGIEAIQPVGEPLVPSIILTILQLE